MPLCGKVPMTATSHDGQTERQYEPPEVKDYGKLADLTAGASDGCYLDASFPSGTMKSQLGFSC